MIESLLLSLLFKNSPRSLMNRRDCILKTLGTSAALLGPTLATRGTLAATTPARPWRLLVLGDSLSAEYGLRRGSGWVALLQARLQAQRPGAEVVNASISGDTTSGGRARLPALLSQHQPSHLIIELGANDALRGLPLNMTEANLAAMVKAGQAAGCRVALVGMQVPPNYGGQYTRDFAALYAKVAQAGSVKLVPFLLKGVADAPDADRLFQADRIHPLEAAHPRMLDNIWPVVVDWLKPGA
jgi:acyl-CoA thioesterase-1